MKTRTPQQSRDDFVEIMGIILTVALAGVSWWAFYGIGVERGRDAVRASAIEAGVAHWTVDEKTGATKFEWIKPEGKE